jgi:hypothetical protein
MRILLLLGDLLIIFGVCLGAVIIYKKIFSPKRSEKETKAYEQGFHDAVLYFGLDDLYNNDEKLKSKMIESFNLAGISCEEHFTSRREKVFS